MKNPHSILATLETRPQDVFEIWPPARSGGTWNDVLKAAREMGVKINTASKRPHPKKKRPEGRKGTAEAIVKEHPGTSLEALFTHTADSGLWIALDTVQDPQNLGTIFRTSAFFGVKGIVLTRDRSAPLSNTAYDVASGGIEHVPFTLQTNLGRVLDIAK
ncbi:MAG: 23S rRNA (guanosine(2251)-2'-O)-methyltransferase RlmB, partial [bacterium]|nr:23S rRNA (guanosine(2251)-2'-O)-methyltransferase RlmB [bacterium]